MQSIETFFAHASALCLMMAIVRGKSLPPARTGIKTLIGIYLKCEHQNINTKLSDVDQLFSNGCNASLLYSNFMLLGIFFINIHVTHIFNKLFTPI